MIQKKMMSQCVSMDYCNGYNDALKEIQIELKEFRDWLKFQMEYNREESNKFINMGCPDFKQARYENMADAFEECIDKLNNTEESK